MTKPKKPKREVFYAVQCPTYLESNGGEGEWWSAHTRQEASDIIGDCCTDPRKDHKIFLATRIK